MSYGQVRNIVQPTEHEDEVKDEKYTIIGAEHYSAHFEHEDEEHAQN